MKKLLKNSLVTAIMATTGIQAHAELTYQTSTSNSQGQGKISWGDETNLNRARTIMYTNSDPFVAQSPTYNHQTNFNSHTNNTWGMREEIPFSYYALSKGALVIDAITGKVIYEKNADIVRPIASISKLMTALVVSESGASMNDIITIDSLDFKTPKKSGSDVLRVGDQMNRAEMLLMMLMKSENPASKALARTDPLGYEGFMAKMNQKAQELGMYNTRFYDPSGLDVRNVASPRDIARLAQQAYQHHLVSQFSTTPNRDFWVNNFTQGPRLIPARSTSYMVRDGLYNIGLSKTGYIREAGNCVVFETTTNGRPSIVVLLGAPDSKTRWQDAENIIANLSMMPRLM